jgi:Family of unknown function (DUF6879)
LSIQRVISDLADPAFGQLFTNVRRAWFRLETLQRYDVPYEHDDLARFLRGEPIEATAGPWQAMSREHVAAGRELARVHVIEEPLSDYVRYELHAYAPNLDAGEDVRLIPVRHGAWPTGLPQHDYWLFDDERLWLMDYDPAAAFQAARLVDDPPTVERHREWRDAALATSISLVDYAAAHEPV